MTDEELTRLAAQKVMGWTSEVRIMHGRGKNDQRTHTEYTVCRQMDRSARARHEDEWHPLTDWGAAGEIVEKMRADGWRVNIHIDEDGCHVTLTGKHGSGLIGQACDNEKTSTHAITIAALLAVGAISEDQL